MILTFRSALEWLSIRPNNFSPEVFSYEYVFTDYKSGYLADIKIKLLRMKQNRFYYV
jgi:hypothetical protein